MHFKRPILHTTYNIPAWCITRTIAGSIKILSFVLVKMNYIINNFVFVKIKEMLKNELNYMQVNVYAGILFAYNLVYSIYR